MNLKNILKSIFINTLLKLVRLFVLLTLTKCLLIPQYGRSNGIYWKLSKTTFLHFDADITLHDKYQF